MLVDNVPVACSDDEYWDWKSSIPQDDQTALGVRIHREFFNGVIVSTVFLGEADEYSPAGNPLVFETFVYGGEYSGRCVRATTLEGAKRLHDDIVDKVVQKLLEETGEIIDENDTEVIDDTEISVILGED